MAAKYQLITELYRRTGIAVAKNPQAWQGFLSSACRNYNSLDIIQTLQLGISLCMLRH